LAVSFTRAWWCCGLPAGVGVTPVGIDMEKKATVQQDWTEPVVNLANVQRYVFVVGDPCVQALSICHDEKY